MGLSEADTRAKLIDPALHARGWTEGLIRREETAGAIEIESKPRKQLKGRVDYNLHCLGLSGRSPSLWPSSRPSCQPRCSEF